MGTPRKQRRKFARPKHPWQTERIAEEKELCLKYGLNNRREVWKAKSKLARIRDQAKKLLALKGEEAEKQRKELIAKLNIWGIKIKTLDDILALDVTSLLGRRLQTVVFRKALANTPKQARQFITHNHVFVCNHKVSTPSYIVLAKEEDLVKLADDIQVEKGVTEKTSEEG